jgi:hypothetical protein
MIDCDVWGWEPVVKLVLGRVMLAASLVCGCSSGLDKETTALLDATAFIMFQLEDGATLAVGGQITRKVVGKTIVFAGAPDGDVILESPEKCIVKIQFSTDLGRHTVNINFNAVARMEVEPDHRGNTDWDSVAIEGSKSYCTDNKCEDRHWLAIIGPDGMSPSERIALRNRYTRVIAFIRKRCPGTPS